MEIEGVRRSARIAESKVFFNIHGVENEGSEESPPAVVFKFRRDLAKSIDFGHELEKGDLKYAPSLRNPYYMSIPASMLPVLAGDSPHMPLWATEARHVNGQETKTVTRAVPSVEITSFFYISLKLFYDIANDEVDWISLSNLVDPQVGPTSNSETRKEAETLKGISFAKLADPPKRDPIDKQPYNPPIIKCEADEEMKVEEESKEEELPLDLVNQTHNSSSVINWHGVRQDIRDETGPNKGRRLYIPIRHQRGWLIWIRKPNWNIRREERRGQLRRLKESFEKLWMVNTATDPESAGGYRPRYSSVDLGFPLYVVPQPNMLKRLLGWKADQIDTEFAGVVGKVNSGKTQPNMRLIIVTHEQVKREGLIEMSGNPFKLFTTYISTDDFHKYMKDLEILTNTNQTSTRRNAHRSQETTDAHLMSWLQQNYEPMTVGYTPPQEKARESVQKGKLRRGKLYWEEGTCGSTWCIGVGRDKINDAGGKRIAIFSPKQIMGISANDAAENAFGWNLLDQAHDYLGHKHKLSNGMYMAEWLHLCAFSWGGLTTSPKRADLVYRSSDIPENLIIGTSETNSVMTRFEKAWQSLVRDESGLRVKGEENSNFSARLIVTRNHSTKSVIRDTKLNDRYCRITSSITPEESSIAERYHFVAYTVSYSIKFPKGCRLLSMPSDSTLETTFYPFLRPLYHRLEDQLDHMLYERIKAQYKEEPILFGLNATSISGKVFDGTMLQSLSLVDVTGLHTVEKKKGSPKKVKNNHPYNTAGERRLGAGTNPFLSTNQDWEPQKKLKT